jgi:hypothetical protein
MKAAFSATRPLTSIKRFLTVYSDPRSRNRDRIELRQCGFRGGTATALSQSTASRDATAPISVWTAVVECRTAALARRFSREERQDVNRERTGRPLRLRSGAVRERCRGCAAAVATRSPLSGGEGRSRSCRRAGSGSRS